MYERLQSEAAALGVEVQERVLMKRIKGLYGDNVIWINKDIETTIEKACVLAEELGHHHMTAGDIINQSKIENVKQEKLARNWAYNNLVTFESLIKAFKAGCRSRFEISEMLDITEDFLEESLKFYHEKYGNKVRADDNHVLFFSPLAIYEDI